jgi:pre-rRNA-processing protein TSR1
MWNVTLLGEKALHGSHLPRFNPPPLADASYRNGVATIYAPIAYLPQPILAFKQTAAGGLRLAATGTLRGCDPDRIVLKKIVLTGFPVKVHKSKAVVRFMFHTPEDVRWFKPVELWTKAGRRGRILEPVGTHGAMKCIFDGPLKHQDSVCMSLYKRVYPKWPEDMQFA